MSRANRKFDLEKFFVTLSDRNRLRLINLMGDEVCVCFFVEILKMPQPRGSRRLAYLRRAGVMAARREGKCIRYKIITPSDGRAARMLEELREYLSSDREMRRDRARLVKVRCAPALPARLQSASLPARLLASLAGPDRC